MMDAVNFMQFYGEELKGVVHVGANDGAECAEYTKASVDFAIFVEPLTEPFAALQKRIEGINGYRAYQALCGDQDQKEVEFFVANNRGESSSIFTPTLHKEFFPEIAFTAVVKLNMITLDTLFGREDLDFTKYNLLVIDTQGSELLVIKGAERLLPTIDAIYTEVSEVPLYEGSCTLAEVTAYLASQGFTLRMLHIGRHLYGNAFFFRSKSAFKK